MAPLSIISGLRALVDKGEVPSAAYAVVSDGEVAVGGFGGAGPESVFQIGSVTKVVTGLLLADMAERGQLLRVRSGDQVPAGRGTGPGHPG